MKIRRILVPLVVVLFVVAGASTVLAQDWQKLGEKNVGFNIDHDRINAQHKGRIREIHLAVRNAPVKFKRVVLNYMDGERKELEYLEDVQVGQESRSITIEGDGHVIKSVDFWFETDSLRGKKAKVTVYGRS